MTMPWRYGIFHSREGVNEQVLCKAIHEKKTQTKGNKPINLYLLPEIKTKNLLIIFKKRSIISNIKIKNGFHVFRKELI